LHGRHPGVPAALVHALARRHGTLADAVLRGVRDETDLGIHFGAQLFEREVEYLIRHEWAQTGDDVLWRRTKAGLDMSASERARLDEYVRERVVRQAADPSPARGGG
jgi:glycerol-3-phosphate dehydrogenase